MYVIDRVRTECIVLYAYHACISEYAVLPYTYKLLRLSTDIGSCPSAAVQWSCMTRKIHIFYFIMDGNTIESHGFWYVHSVFAIYINFCQQQIERERERERSIWVFLMALPDHSCLIYWFCRYPYQQCFDEILLERHSRRETFFWIHLWKISRYHQHFIWKGNNEVRSNKIYNYIYIYREREGERGKER